MVWWLVVLATGRSDVVLLWDNSFLMTFPPPRGVLTPNSIGKTSTVRHDHRLLNCPSGVQFPRTLPLPKLTTTTWAHLIIALQQETQTRCSSRRHPPSSPTKRTPRRPRTKSSCTQLLLQKLSSGTRADETRHLTRYFKVPDGMLGIFFFLS